MGNVLKILSEVHLFKMKADRNILHYPLNVSRKLEG
jgi:hypothetical protein